LFKYHKISSRMARQAAMATIDSGGQACSLA
jgi:hypothetical protein